MRSHGRASRVDVELAPPDPTVTNARRSSGILRDALGYLPAMLVPSVVALASATVFTRLFEPDQYGRFTFALAIVGPMATLLSQWLAQPLERFLIEYRLSGELPTLHYVVRQALRAVVGIVLAGTVLGSLTVFAAGWGFDVWLLFTGAMLALVSQTVTTVLLPMLSASFEIGAYRRFLVNAALASFFFSLLLVLLASRNVAWLMWGHALGLAVLVPSLVRRTGFAAPTAFTSADRAQASTILKRLLAFGVPMAVWHGAIVLLSISDRYVLEAFRGTGEQAIFSVNYNLIASIAALANVPVNIAAGPILYAAWAAGQRATVQDTIARMTELYAVVAIALIGGVAVVGEAFVRIVLSEHYHDGQLILVPVAVGVAIQGAANVGRKGLELHERTPALALCALSAAGLNIALNTVFVPTFGIIAAAYTTTISYLAYAILIGIATRHVLPWRVPVTRILSLAGMGWIAWCAATYVAEAVVPYGPWAEFVAGGVGFILVYSALILVLARSRLTQLIAST